MKPGPSTSPAVDVVVVGAGIVGAACALAAARNGLRVTVVDRGPIAGGTSSAGEGNILVSDKPAGPELDLALASLGHWAEIADHLESATGRPRGGFELEDKGGLMVALRPGVMPALEELAAGQRAGGVHVQPVAADRLRDAEPELAPGLGGGLLYPQDAQLQPMLATAAMLAGARALGARVRTGVAVTGLLRDGDAVTGVRLAGGDRVPAGAVVNAAGPWAAAIGELAGVAVPVQPRRGVILVTQRLPVLIRRKVYSAAYVENVASGDAGLAASAVVEGTPSGTVLIGASRERVGFDPAAPTAVVRRLAAQAIELFPRLSAARLLRTYRGYRPYSPDHLPLIGADPRAPGLVHACGHEGAGVALAAVTGHLVGQLLTGVLPSLDLTPFAPERFDAASAAAGTAVDGRGAA